MVILEVEWSEGGHIYYSDQEVAGCQPKVISLGGFDTSMQLQGSSDSQEVSVVLDDSDGEIKAIYNSMDVHKRPASVYLLHKGNSLATDKILVFKGELVTPIECNETERTISFNILSKLDSVQVGFSMEEGDFPNIPDEALGKAWPLVFGQVCHLPAVKVRAPRRGYLLGGVGISDFTLDARICQAMLTQCPSQSTGSQTHYTRYEDNYWEGEEKETIGPDLECVNRRFAEICRLSDLQAQQQAYEYDEIEIYNGESFPQGEKINIFIDGATFTGTFSGNTFSITSRKHPDEDDIATPTCQEVQDAVYGMIAFAAQIGGGAGAPFGGNESTSAGGYWELSGQPGGSQRGTWIPNDQGTAFQANQTQSQAYQSCDQALVATPGMKGGPKESWSIYDGMPEASFFWAPAGSEVFMESESEILYIVSLLPGTVDGVAAFRTAPNGFSYLTSVPESYYTVYETDYDGYQVVEIGMSKPLRLYEDEEWEDEIYVSFTSSVGPNPCDIIEWLVDKYTDLTVDATTFASVKAALTNYPTNFYITTRPDVYQLINDIAYQSRCAVFIRNGVLYIKYLSEEPTSERTLTESDILSGSFVEFLSETEDVYTTHNIKWSKGGAAVRKDYDNDRELVLKYNVKKYGTVEEEWDYYCLNIYDLVLKSGTFWLIRKANSWKKAKFELPVKHMDLDVGDCVTLNFSQFGDAVKCVIESMTLNPDNNTISVQVWTPVRSGETEEFYWAWPAAKSCAAIWPLSGDTNGGGGYNFEVTPPIGHILLGGAKRDDQRVITSGDLHPSDLCDELPTPDCELSDFLDFGEIDPAVLAKQIAQTASRQAMENAMTGGGNAGGSKDEKDEEGECGTGAGCNYKVIVQWHTSLLQGQATSLGGSKPVEGPCGGPCKCRGGCPSCVGPIWSVCHTHGSPGMASYAAQYWSSMYGKRQDGWWECGETRVLSARAEDGEHSQVCGSVSDDVAEPQDGEPIQETKKPTGLTGNEPTVGELQENNLAYDTRLENLGLKDVGDDDVN